MNGTWLSVADHRKGFVMIVSMLNICPVDLGEYHTWPVVPIRSSESIPPFQFVQVLRQLYPQFAQQNQRGGYMQQDAEELYGAVTSALSEVVPIMRLIRLGSLRFLGLHLTVVFFVSLVLSRIFVRPVHCRTLVMPAMRWMPCLAWSWRIP